MFILDDVGFRSVEERDIENIRLLRNDPLVWINLTDIRHITPEMQKKWYENIKDNPEKKYFTLFIQKQTDSPELREEVFLGIIRMDAIDLQNRSIRAGLDIAPKYHGIGWANKAYIALVKYCFDYLNCHRIWLCVLDNNNVGIKLYKSVGFVEEGRYRGAIFRDGKYRDYIVMSILEDEYRAGRS
jgi:RimJ/RimL family protein N-acetyltransferase